MAGRRTERDDLQARAAAIAELIIRTNSAGRKGRWEASALGVTLRVRLELLAPDHIGLQARLTAWSARGLRPGINLGSHPRADAWGREPRNTLAA
jgi:hypothetical protein